MDLKLIIHTTLLTIILSSKQANAVRCYVCAWTAALCQDFNCYNNPDICTNVNFSPTIVRSVECPAGCETFVMTDPNGLVQQWRRNCDSSGESLGQWRDGSTKCTTRYQVGLRITRCTCNDHLCNSGSKCNLTYAILIILTIVHVTFKMLTIDRW